MTTLDDLSERARVLGERRKHLHTLVAALNDGIEALKRDHMGEIRAAIDAASQAWMGLERQVRDHPELFERPRTQVAHGIKFGWEKGKGSISVPDAARTVGLINKHLPDQASVLLQVRETPVKTALAQLSAADLRRVGVEITDAGDRVVIRPADGAVDKMVEALVAEAVST